MKEKIETIKQGVQYCLENYPETRNSDQELIFRYLIQNKYIQRIPKGIMITYEKYRNLPSFESITRCRRKFQEKGLYQASMEVENKRRGNEEEMRDINRWFNQQTTLEEL